MQLGFQDFYRKGFLLKIVAEAIPYCLGFPPPLLFEHYKNAPQPFTKTQNLLQKSDSREAFYFEKHPKLKVSWLGLILVQSLQFKLSNPLGILFCRFTKGNGQNQVVEVFV